MRGFWILLLLALAVLPPLRAAPMAKVNTAPPPIRLHSFIALLDAPSVSASSPLTLDFNALNLEVASPRSVVMPAEIGKWRALSSSLQAIFPTSPENASNPNSSSAQHVPTPTLTWQQTSKHVEEALERFSETDIRQASPEQLSFLVADIASRLRNEAMSIARPPSRPAGVERAREEGPSRAFGEVLILENPEQRIKLGRFLSGNRGHATEVYQLHDDPTKAIRLRKPLGGQHNEYDVRRLDRLTEAFILGHRTLSESGVPAVKIHDHRSPHYAVVDYVEGPRFEEFLFKPEAYSKKQLEAMLHGLVDFARRTASFQIIGDFKSDQMLFDKARGWVLFDWINDNLKNESLHLTYGKWGMAFDAFSYMNDSQRYEGMDTRYYFNKRGNRTPDSLAARWIQSVFDLTHDAIADEKKILRSDYPNREKKDFSARIAHLASSQTPSRVDR